MPRHDWRAIRLALGIVAIVAANLIAPHDALAVPSLLTMYVYRDMDHIDWLPFLKASFERNPISLDYLRNKTVEEKYDVIRSMPEMSIYEDNRLSLPDEVWNFRRGDGIEKAILMANSILSSDNMAEIDIDIVHEKVELKYSGHTFSFSSSKRIIKKISIRGSKYKAG